jgi:hypothetical protein
MIQTHYVPYEVETDFLYKYTFILIQYLRFFRLVIEIKFTRNNLF